MAKTKKRTLCINISNHKDMSSYEAPHNRHSVEILIPSSMPEKGKQHLRTLTDPNAFVIMKEVPVPVSPAAKTKSLLHECFGRLVGILVLFLLFLILKEAWTLKLKDLSVDMVSKVESYLGISLLDSWLPKAKEAMVEFAFMVLIMGMFFYSADDVAEFLGL